MTDNENNTQEQDQGQPEWDTNTIKGFAVTHLMDSKGLGEGRGGGGVDGEEQPRGAGDLPMGRIFFEGRAKVVVDKQYV